MLYREQILQMNVQQLKQVRLADLMGREITQAEMVHVYQAYDAFWMYPGQPRPDTYHALLKSGLHSNGFIFSMLALRRSNWAEIFSYQMLRAIRGSYSGPVDWVIGPAYGAEPIVYNLGRLLNANHAVVEKDKNDQPTKWNRLVVDKGETVLIVNELMTTGAGSTLQAWQAVAEQNPIKDISFAQVAPVIAHRSGDYELANGVPVLPIYHFDIQNFDPNECPYCQAGSVAIKPKAENNWQLMTR